LWLPGGNEERLTTAMDGWAGGSLDKPKNAGSIHPLLADGISRYFEGGRVGFEDVEVALPGFSGFASMVLEGLRAVEWGNAVTYKDIALSTGHPGSARAIGMIMSKNPIPLIIPCHRVIRSDGGLGGFSGPGGVGMKKRMLLLEGFGK
jgi:O-6-methylguanine DNA methyltransferase